MSGIERNQRKNRTLEILLIEDNPGDAHFFEKLLVESGQEIELHWERDLASGFLALEKALPDVIVLDLELPDSKGTDTVARIVERAPALPVVVLTRQGSVDQALATLEVGATEYLRKDELAPNLLARTLQWAVERKAMEKELGEHEEQLRSITENISDGIYRSTPSSGLVYANQAFAAMLGYENPQEILEADPRNFYADPEERERLREILRTEGHFDTVEVEFSRKDESTFTGLLSGTVVRDETGEIKYFDGAITDITERVQRKRKLRVLSAALEQVDDKVFITDPEGQIKYVNEAFEEITGYREEEVVGKTPALLQSGEHDEAFYENLWETVLSGETFRAEFVNEKKDGTRYVEDESISPLRNEEGEITHFVSSGRDISERRRRKRKLERQNDLFEQAEEIASVGAWEYDVQAGEITLTDQAYRVHGLAPGSDMTPDRSHELFHPEDRPEADEAFRRAVEEGEPYDLEARLITEEGEERWIRSRGEPQREEGEVVRVCGAIQNITERKQAERALEEREEYLSVTLQSIGDAVIATDRDGRLTEMNSVAERLTGWSQEEAKGKLLDDILTLHSARTGESLESPADEVLQGGRTVGLANRTVLTSRDGTEYQIADSAAPIQSEEGELLGVVLVFRDVTEKYERRRRMERQNDLFANAQDLANVGGWEYDVRADEHIWTDQVYDIYGLPKSFDPTVQEGIAHYHPEDRPTIREVFTRAVEEGEPYDVELRLISEEGEQRWVRTRGVPQFEDGEVVRVRGSIQDITDRKERERKLRERGRQLEQIRANITDVVWMSTPNKDRMEFISETYEDVWGRSLQQLKEQPLSFVDAIHPEDRDRVLSALETQRENPEAYAETYRVVQPDGEVRWVQDRAAGVYDENGHLERIIGVATDITEKQEYEREIEAVNTRLQLALESTNTGIFDWDMETDEVIWDEASERLFGYEPGEFPGRYEGWADRVHPDDLPDAEADIERAIENQDEYQTEFRVHLPDDTQRWIQARGVVKYDDAGTPVRMLGIHTDVTDRKEREERLREAKEEAERMNRLKSAFLANMSHEIRTPLTSILGFAEMIGEQVSGDEEGLIPRYARLIERSGRRLMDTLTGVLNLSKLEAGEMDLSAEPVDLSEEVREIVEQYQPRAEDASIDLQVDTGKTQVWALGDEGGIQIALRNLVSNALKYTEEGGQVSVRTYQEDQVSVLEVEDTGIGMDPESVPDLFEAFSQESEGIGREYEGTGLGLTVTKEAVDRMGGTIEVETSRGEGSQFTIRLPRAEEQFPGTDA